MKYIVTTPCDTVSARGSFGAYGYGILPYQRIILRIIQRTNTLGFQ